MLHPPKMILTLAAASALLALGACAPPAKDNTGNQTESGVKAGEATSAADFGGMDGLVAAAKKEGQLNVIALPPDWANYGEIIERVLQEVRHQGQLRPARRHQPGRDQRGQTAEPAPTAHPTCSTSDRPLRWRTPTCSRRTRCRHSMTSRRSSRIRTAPGSTTTAATCPSATTRPRSRRSPRSTTCCAPSSRARSPSTVTPRPPAPRLTGC